jgi:hypothetical protein
MWIEASADSVAAGRRMCLDAPAKGRRIAELSLATDCVPSADIAEAVPYGTSAAPTTPDSGGECTSVVESATAVVWPASVSGVKGSERALLSELSVSPPWAPGLDAADRPFDGTRKCFESDIWKETKGGEF